MRLLSAATIVLPLALLVGSARAAAPAQDKLIERAKSYEASLGNEGPKVKLRHNVERLIGLWSAAKTKAKGPDKLEALEGELRAWKLLSRWSGRADDKEVVAQLQKQLDESRAAVRLAEQKAEEARARAKAQDAKADRAKALAKAERAKPQAPKAERAKDDEGVSADELLAIVRDVQAAFPELPTGPSGQEAASIAGDEDRPARAARAEARPMLDDDGIVAKADDEDPAEAADAADGDDAVLGQDGAVTVAAKLKRSTREASRPREGSSFLRIRRIVVDAGHGGKDFGAIGRNGLREKDVNLAIALELGRQLHKRLGVKVVYTRSSDEFISLHRRSQIANASNADLFISVHANSHKKRSISGVETYYLNTTSDAYAGRLAARENLGPDADDSSGDDPEPGIGMSDSDQAMLPNGALGRDLRLILADLAMRSATVESRRLAGYVQSSIVGKLKKRYDDVQDLGVKHALFYVLLGARMPSILIETGFVTSPEEASRLGDAKYRIEVASAIAQGVARFISEREAIARRIEAGKADGTLASVRR